MLGGSQEIDPNLVVIPLKKGFLVRQLGDNTRNIDYFDFLEDLIRAYPRADIRRL